MGIAGLGDRGRQLLGAFLAAENVRVVALCDVHPERLKKALDHARRRGRVAGYSDLSALVEAKDVDAVVLATPVHWHEAHTLAALDAGKHVYCEKPMALTPEGCGVVLEACRRALRARARLSVRISAALQSPLPRERRISSTRRGRAGAIRSRSVARGDRRATR